MRIPNYPRYSSVITITSLTQISLTKNPSCGCFCLSISFSSKRNVITFRPPSFYSRTFSKISNILFPYSSRQRHHFMIAVFSIHNGNRLHPPCLCCSNRLHDELTILELNYSLLLFVCSWRLLFVCTFHLIS